MINRIQPNLPASPDRVGASYTKDVSRTDSEVGVSPHSAGTPQVRQARNASAEVVLSDDALALQRILQAVQNSPDVRQDLVQSIREQLEAGTYQVDADALAEKLLTLLTQRSPLGK